jgi:hypothetical protein
MVYYKPKWINDCFGVTREMFEHVNEPGSIHGLGHVNRVIFLSLVLCKAHGFGEDMARLCYAAAALHDLSRKHDGICAVHGADAVDYFERHYLGKLRFANYLRSNSEINTVMDAVKYHCIDDSAITSLVKLKNKVLAVLKDADALDRCRFGDIVNIDMLRLERTEMFVDMANRLYLATGHDASIESVWEEGVKIFNPKLGFSRTVKDGWVEGEDPKVRAVRRFISSENSLKVFELGSTMLKRDVMGGVIECCREIRFSPSELMDYAKPAIAVSDEALKEIENGSTVKTIWETGPTWHSKVNDLPQDTRAYNEHRLFGEKLNHCPYGFLLNKANETSTWGGALVKKRIGEIYGRNILILKPEILKSCTFTFGDSQESPFTAPCNALSVAAMYLASKALGVFPSRPRFIELQIHQKVSYRDVEYVERID